MKQSLVPDYFLTIYIPSSSSYKFMEKQHNKRQQLITYYYPPKSLSQDIRLNLAYIPVSVATLIVRDILLPMVQIDRLSFIHRCIRTVQWEHFGHIGRNFAITGVLRFFSGKCDIHCGNCIHEWHMASPMDSEIIHKRYCEHCMVCSVSDCNDNCHIIRRYNTCGTAHCHELLIGGFCPKCDKMQLQRINALILLDERDYISDSPDPVQIAYDLCGSDLFVESSSDCDFF